MKSTKGAKKMPPQIYGNDKAISFADGLDQDNELSVRFDEYSEVSWINRKDAERMIEHLIDVFDIDRVKVRPD